MSTVTTAGTDADVPRARSRAGDPAEELKAVAALALAPEGAGGDRHAVLVQGELPGPGPGGGGHAEEGDRAVEPFPQAHDGRVVDLMAAVPSVVYGLWGFSSSSRTSPAWPAGSPRTSAGSRSSADRDARRRERPGRARG